MGKPKITKKFFVLLCTLLSVTSLMGQIDTAFHNYYETAGGMTRSGRTAVFHSWILTNGFVGKTFVYGIRNGQQVFKNTLIKHETTTINHMISVSGGRVVYVGWAHGCDYMDSTQMNFISCIDTMGNILFDGNYKDYNSTHFGGLDVFKQVQEFSDGSLYVITDTTLFHFNSAGALLSKTIIPTGSTSFCVSPQNTLVLTRWNYFAGYKGLCAIDTSGNILVQDTCSATFKKIVAGINGYYALSQTGVIYRFDAALHRVATSQILQGTHKIVDFDLRTDTLFCAGYDTSNTFSVIRLDTALSLISFFDPGYKQIIPAAISSSTSSMLVLSSESASNYHNPGISLNEIYKSNNGMNVTKDAGVVQIQLDSAYSTYFYGGSVTYFSNYYRMKVVVRNFGSDTLRTFTLNHHPAGWPICGAWYYHQNFNLTLAPGQSITVTTPLIGGDGGACFCPPPTSNYPVTIPNMCFWTMSPDHESDMDHSNDDFCATVTYTATVGLQELEYIKHKAEIYPNPFSDEVVIAMDQPLAADVSIYSVEGKVLRRLSAISGDTKVSLNDLSAGIFFAVITFKDGYTRVLKLVK